MAKMREALVTGVVSLVLGAIGGFASSTLMLKSDISSVSERVTKLETKDETVWQSAIKRSEDNKESMRRLNLAVNEIQRTDEARRILRAEIDRIEENIRNDTLQELREILER